MSCEERESMKGGIYRWLTLFFKGNEPSIAIFMIQY
jgi:hypothetical protein